MTRGLAGKTAESRVDWKAVKARFPALQRTVRGKKLHYLDTAATAQKPDTVIEAEARYYREHNSNVHRGIHTLADEATQLYEECRERVARFVGAPDPAGVVMTRNATSALNLVARGLEHLLNPGDEILLTEMEHHANLVPWIQLAKRTAVVLRHVQFDPETGLLDEEDFAAKLARRTKVVSVTHMSNVLATINPVATLAEVAHGAGALVVVDAAQSVGRMAVDLRALGADMLVFSAHKCYGPMGLGFLVSTPEVLGRLDPLEGGGEMISEVHLDRATWAEIPQRFEAGTPNVAAAAAFPAALDLLEEIGVGAIQEHETQLGALALDRLEGLGKLVVYGPTDALMRGGVVSFSDERVHPHDMATLLDECGVAVRAGHHCAQPLHRRLGVVATTRASFGVYTSEEDVEALIDAIAFARRYFGS